MSRNKRTWFGLLVIGLWGLLAPAMVQAQGSADAMIRLLESGRLPEARIGAVVDLVAQRGDADQLGFLFTEATKPDGYNDTLRMKTLQALREATKARKVIPAGDLAPLAKMLTSDDAAEKSLGVELSGLWKVESAAEPLAQIALSSEEQGRLRRQAIAGLGQIGGPVNEQTIAKLAQADQPLEIRYLGVAALTKVDLDKSATIAAEVLASADTSVDPSEMITAFLEHQTGPAKLAAAIAEKDLDANIAKMCLRRVYAIGRSDAELVDVLNEAAGIESNPKPLTDDELKAMSEEVLAKGDAARGEMIFRSAELSCMKCHAVSGAGGDIGPDLSPVGANSPVDYMITSILQPELVVKEAYLMRTVLTIDGKVYQGVVVSEDDQRLILKEGSGQEVVIPLDDVDAEKEGGSLMPKGLANFLTQQEFLDLNRFLAELGKPGPYVVRSTPTVQRWRALKELPSALSAESVPTVGEFESTIAEAAEDDWVPAYGTVGGMLPVEELAQEENPVRFLYAEVDVVEQGSVRLKLNATQGVRVWIGYVPHDPAQEIVTDLPVGKHRIYLRVDTRKFPEPGLKLVVEKPSGSTAQYTVVDGP
ncbi:MAG: hypothetical protein WDZ51_11440 [Pirellulaceae bacterium]